MSSHHHNSSSNSTVQLSWRWYTNQLKTNPIITKALTSAFIAALGNLIGQKLVEKKKLDVSRLLKFALLGGGVAPLAHYWHLFLERNVKGPYLKLIIHQVVWSPIVTTIFYVVLSLLDGLSDQPKRAIATLKANWFPTVKANWKFWPIANFIMFMYIPPHLRVLFANLIGLIWAIILSVVVEQSELQLSSAEESIQM